MTNNQFELPKDDMAFRKIYKNLLEEEKLTTVFRPGVRDCNRFRWYCPEDIVNARVIDQQGLDRARVAPVFLVEPVKKIQVEQVEVKTLGSLSSKDFIGSSPDVYDKKSLIYHLGLIYNLDISSLLDDSPITRIQFRYITQKEKNHE